MFEERSVDAFRSTLDAIEQDVALRRRLVPNKELPTGSPEEVSAAWNAHLRDWLERYPDDPRLREKAVWSSSSTDEMETHVEQGLAHIDTFAKILTRSDETRAWLHYGQALVLVDRHRDDEARAV